MSIKNHFPLFHIRKIYRRFFSKPSKEQEDYEYLKSCGVETEYGNVCLFGKPIINIAKGARIIIGKGVTLVSENMINGVQYNAAGINHPVILSALVPGSCIIIHDNVGMSGTCIVATTKVEIGENSLFGVNTNIYDTDFHCIDSEKRNMEKNILEAEHSPITIGNNIWIGANSTVLKGCNIGNNSIIGAMSLVNKNIPESVIAAGVPVKIIREI